MSHVSNALGTINPVREIIEQAHARGAVVLIDGAQAVPHLPVDVQALDCDFYVFSSHKMFGPTGVGVLYGRRSLLEAMPPYQGGGDMIASVTFEKTCYNAVPYKFEAGTPNIGGVAGFGAAHRLSDGHRSRRRARARGRRARLRDRRRARAFRGARIIGEARHKTGVLSFVLEGVHPHDAGTILDTRRRGGPDRPALRPAGDGPLRHHGDDPGVARRSTTRARTSTRWCARWRVRGVVAVSVSFSGAS